MLTILSINKGGGYNSTQYVNFDKSIIELYFFLISFMLTTFLEDQKSIVY